MKVVTIETNKGTIKAELFEDKVPKTVDDPEIVAKTKAKWGDRLKSSKK